MRTVAGFVHRPGVHCGSTALRDLAESCAGVALSEAMCFGLGAGLGFAYTVIPGASPSRALCGRAPYLEEHFFSHLGIPFAWQNAPLGWDTLCSHVEQNVPLLALTDLFYLDYYASPVHFGGHAVVVAGCMPPEPGGGDGEGHVLVADTAWPDLQQVPYRHLRQALHSEALPFPVDGHWTPVPRFAVPRRVLPQAIRAALATCARCYLHTPPPPELARLGASHYGISGLRVMAATLPEWRDAPDFPWCCRFAYQMIEKRGTGGGAFRRMYASFLREARDLVPELRAGAVTAMDRAAALWTEAASLFRAMQTPSPAATGGVPPGGLSSGGAARPGAAGVVALLRQLSCILQEAASHEEEAFHLLAAL